VSGALMLELIAFCIVLHIGLSLTEGQLNHNYYHDLELQSAISHHSDWSVITAHNLTPGKRDD